MSEIQRYWTSCSDGWITMEPSEKGTWVRLEDHQRILVEKDSEIERLKAERNKAKEQWDICLQGWQDATELRKEVEAERDKLRATVGRLKAPVSDAEAKMMKGTECSELPRARLA